MPTAEYLWHAKHATGEHRRVKTETIFMDWIEMLFTLLLREMLGEDTNMIIPVRDDAAYHHGYESGDKSGAYETSLLREAYGVKHIIRLERDERRLPRPDGNPNAPTSRYQTTGRLSLTRDPRVFTVSARRKWLRPHSETLSSPPSAGKFPWKGRGVHEGQGMGGHRSST